MTMQMSSTPVLRASSMMMRRQLFATPSRSTSVCSGNARCLRAAAVITALRIFMRCRKYGGEREDAKGELRAFNYAAASQHVILRYSEGSLVPLRAARDPSEYLRMTMCGDYWGDYFTGAAAVSSGTGEN